MRAVLTYHSIDRTGSIISIDPAIFRRQIEWLSSSSIPVVAIPELLDMPAERDAVALSFDDGFANFETDAWPLLRHHGLPATLFMPSAHVGATNAWEALAGDMPRLALLAWEQLARLAEEGLTIGAHSHTHPDLRTLPSARLRAEIDGVWHRIVQEIGTPPDGFAYPFGRYDDNVTQAVRARYAWACTTDLRPLGRSEDPFRIPRLDMYCLRAPGQLEAWGTPRFRIRLRLRNWARRARQMTTSGRAS